MTLRVLAVVGLALVCATAMADEDRVRAFYDALARRDVDRAALFWATDAPDKAVRLRDYRRLLASVGPEPLELRDLTVLELRERAPDEREIELHVSIVNAGGGALFRQTVSRRIVTFVREKEEWKIRSELSAAEALVRACGEEAAGMGAADPEIAAALHGEATRLRIEGDYVRSERFARLALVAAERYGDHASIASALNELGALHFSQSNYDEAVRFYDESLEARRETGERRGIAATLMNIGITHRFLGDYDRAVELYEEALTSARELGDEELSASLLTSIAIVHAQQGRFAEAIHGFSEALAVQERLGNLPGMATATNSLGATYSRQGDDRIAREMFEKSLALHERTGNRPGIASALNNLGSVAAREGRIDDAEDAFHRSLVLKQMLNDAAGTASVQMHLGSLAMESGRLEEAECWFEEARARYEQAQTRVDMPQLFLNLGYLAAGQKEWDRALDFALQSADEARTIGRMEYAWRADTLAGRALTHIGTKQAAAFHFEDAVRAIEDLRANVAGGEEEQALFFERVVEPYHGLVQLAAERGDAAEAFRWAEQARARVLLDVMRHGRRPAPAPRDEREAEVVREMRRVGIALARTRSRGKSVASLLEEQERLRVAVRDLRSRRLASDPAFRRREAELGGVTLASLGKALKPDTAIVEYVMTKDSLFAIVITSGAKATVQRLGSAAEATRLAGRLHEQIARRDLGFRAAAKAAHELFIARLAAPAASRRHWIIVPDGALWLVPFQALVDAKGAFVIESREIAYAPSAAVWEEMNRGRSRRKQQSVVAFDTLADESSSLDALRESYAGALRVFEGEAAAEAKFKREIARAHIVHVVAHGVFDDRHPMASHLQLAGGNGEDGLVQAWEILELKGSAELVVLSACETARGRDAEGEGLIGLSWAMFVAGTPSMVVSHWRVDSQSSRTLMAGFHRALQKNGSALQTARALREASLAMIARPDTRHPFHWAAYAALGAR